VECAGEVTIQNLTIECGKNTQRAVNVINQPATLKLDNVTVPYATYAVNVAASAIGGAKLEIVNSNITGYAALNITAENASATVKDSTLTGNGIAGEPNAFATIAIQANGVKVTVEGGKLVAAEDANESILQINSGYTGAVVVLDAELQYTESGIVDGIDSENNLITLRGAYADTIFADGYIYQVNAEDAALIDVKGIMVAYNKDTKTAYTNLADGLSELLTGETLMLMVDLSDENTRYTLWEGNLDLNGHKLTVRSLGAAFKGANVIDSSEAKTGLLASEKVSLYVNNAQVPLKTAEGYKFAEAYVLGGVRTGNGYLTFGLGMDKASDLLIAQLLNDPDIQASDLNLQYRVKIDWVSASNGNPVTQYFSFREDIIEQAATVWANGYTGAMTMNIYGTEGKNVGFTAQLVVTVNGSEVIFEGARVEP
jgi:putative NADPH-quinone reductase